jgi:hypothetical protein
MPGSYFSPSGVLLCCSFLESGIRDKTVVGPSFYFNGCFAINENDLAVIGDRFCSIFM